MSPETKDELIKKFTSRKFWFCVAIFLASIGTGIAGLATDNTVIAGIGVGCTVVSGAIYAACEAYTDGKSLESTTINVQAAPKTASDAAEIINSLASTTTPSTPPAAPAEVTGNAKE